MQPTSALSDQNLKMKNNLKYRLRCKIIEYLEHHNNKKDARTANLAAIDAQHQRKKQLAEDIDSLLGRTLLWALPTARPCLRGKMCYYRRLHFVLCSHLYWVANPVIRYCSAAHPVSDNIDFSTAHDYPPGSQFFGQHSFYGPLPFGVEPDGESPSTPSSSPARRHFIPSIFSTLHGRRDGDSMTPFSSSDSSPSAFLHPRARRLGDQPRNIPCGMRLSHPFRTYRIFTICPACMAIRGKQDAGLGELKEGLEDVRLIVERLSAMEDMRCSAEEANVERIDEKKNLKEELSERVVRSEESELEEAEFQTDGNGWIGMKGQSAEKRPPEEGSGSW